jgi:NitT/TauT family transport system ATP-binding protein
MAAHPGRVVGESEVDAPYPRDEQFRTSPDYAASAARRHRDALRGAMGVEGEGGDDHVLH